MSIYRSLLLLGALCLREALPATRADDLPSAAAKRIKEFEAEEEAIRHHQEVAVAKRNRRAGASI